MKNLHVVVVNMPDYDIVVSSNSNCMFIEPSYHCCFFFYKASFGIMKVDIPLMKQNKTSIFIIISTTYVSLQINEKEIFVFMITHGIINPRYVNFSNTPSLTATHKWNILAIY